jgi:hypothetical protein
MAEKKADPMELVRQHEAHHTLKMAMRDILEISVDTGIQAPDVRTTAVRKAQQMLERNPHLTHKTLSKAAFVLALEEVMPEKGGEIQVRDAIGKSLGSTEQFWRVLVPTMRRELANSSC